MKFLDLLYLSFQNFKNRKSRIILTILGVSVGIGTILFLVSLGYGLQALLLEKITTTESLLTLDVIPPENGIITLTPENIEKISKIENVEKVSPQAILPAQISLGDLVSEATVNLVNPDFFSLSGILPDIGRVFTDNDQGKIVVNSTTAELFNLKPEEILHKKLNFILFIPEEKQGIVELGTFNLEKQFEVIGVIEETGTNAEVYLKRNELNELPIKEYQVVKVKVVSDKAMEQVREKLIEMGFLVSALSDTISQANKIFRAVQIVLGIFGITALIVAAIGLVNTMTISLLERTNEIGIMRAIGASTRDIKYLFLGESLIIGFLGGLGGIILGIASARIFNLLINILAKSLGGEPVNLFVFPAWFLIFIILLSTAVGLIGGFWPARRAAKLDPLDALRYK
jgi:putative ABC transport system permease protein